MKSSNAELRGDPPALSAERPSSNDVLGAERPGKEGRCSTQ